MKKTKNEMLGGKPARQRMWEAIRSIKGEFYAVDIERLSDCELANVYHYLRSLSKAQFVTVREVATTKRKGDRLSKAYTLIKNTGIEAPRINAKGEIVTAGPKYELLWRTFRILNTVTTDQLLDHAAAAGLEMTKRSVNTYTRALLDAGYISAAGKDGSRIFTLKPAMNTGPRPPQIQSIKAVYDPNLNKVMHSEDPQEQL